MCNIAGYIGTKAAAPILVDMMLRQEGYNGGFYTGIATLHQGKLLYANMPPRNFPEWYAAFNVKKSDGMYLAPSKRVVIW